MARARVMVRASRHYVKWGLTRHVTAIECASLANSRSAGSAGVAHLVERDVANVQVVGSSPITRSNFPVPKSSGPTLVTDCAASFNRSALKWL